MAEKSKLTPIAAAAGLTLVATLASSPLVMADDNPFAVSEMSGGYMLLAGAEGKCGEGKCGEGKCGGDKADDEGKCGGDKADDEGKCGGDKGDKADGEGKCGEGKCGGDK